MSTSDLSLRQKPESIGHAADVLRPLVTSKPAIWCLRMYDDHWGGANGRKAPDLHELARRARGDVYIAPPPLPKVRKRTLTNPLPQLDSVRSISHSIRRAAQRTDDQTKSLFLNKIPLEIRQLIYEEALEDGEGRLVHILQEHGIIGHWRCRIQNGVDLCDSRGRLCEEGWLSFYHIKFWHKNKTGVRTHEGLVPLLRTCRIIYSEVINTMYSKNIFHFHNPGDLRPFSLAILPQRLNTIHSVVLDWDVNTYAPMPNWDTSEWKAWRKTWAIISKMEGLQEVKVIMKTHEVVVSKGQRIRMCEPMMEIHGLSIFEIIAPKDVEWDWDFAEAAPFGIVKGSRYCQDRGLIFESPDREAS